SIPPFVLDLLVFLYNAPLPTALYTLSLHDALPIYRARNFLFTDFDQCLGNELGRNGEHRDIDLPRNVLHALVGLAPQDLGGLGVDRKSTRLNSSHVSISYAVFCLKKKNKPNQPLPA